MSNLLVSLEVSLIRETDKALLVTDGYVEAWVPKSMLKSPYEHIANSDSMILIHIPEWLAEDKSLA